MKTMLKSKLWP